MKYPKRTKAYREALEEHGEKFEVAFENFGDVEEAITAVTDSYCGCFSSLEDYAKDYIEQSGELKHIGGNLVRYFDYGAFGRDCELEGSIWTARGSEGLHVFFA